ncbi:MAG: alpha-1,2-fucosyltransferase [Paludibacteraceae bacterium]|nr:alpha-1,2-fucosyltransferase [Paludibacteraceae bacterium]
MDGGICSQMLMYLQGQWYAEYGLKVYYDTRWFEVCGLDQFGQFTRDLEFHEMWPTLPFHVIKGWRRWFYKEFFNIGNFMNGTLLEPSTLRHSVYLYGYWDLPSGVYDRLFREKFDISRAQTVHNIHLNINNEDLIVGVHVRRGDLAKGNNPIYGGVTDGYFLHAVDFCKKKFMPQKFYFFSDEPDWVETNICSQIDVPNEIVRGNKAWEDLRLLASCDVIVASQGSFGRCAARLNPQAKLIICDNKPINKQQPNTFYIK